MSISHPPGFQQWAAVRIHLSLIREPPHLEEFTPWTISNLTWYRRSFGPQVWPPMILFWRSTPALTVTPERESPPPGDYQLRQWLPVPRGEQGVTYKDCKFVILAVSYLKYWQSSMKSTKHNKPTLLQRDITWHLQHHYCKKGWKLLPEV